jgi:hypothetical protein
VGQGRQLPFRQVGKLAELVQGDNLTIGGIGFMEFPCLPIRLRKSEECLLVLGVQLGRLQEAGSGTVSATAILDRFLHHAEIVSINGKSYRLRNQAANGDATTAPAEPDNESKPAISPAGSPPSSGVTKRPKNKPHADADADVAACQS